MKYEAQNPSSANPARISAEWCNILDLSSSLILYLVKKLATIVRKVKNQSIPRAEKNILTLSCSSNSPMSAFNFLSSFSFFARALRRSSNLHKWIDNLLQDHHEVWTCPTFVNTICCIIMCVRRIYFISNFVDSLWLDILGAVFFDLIGAYKLL